jgi:hypothetical protein
MIYSAAFGIGVNTEVHLRKGWDKPSDKRLPLFARPRSGVDEADLVVAAAAAEEVSAAVETLEEEGVLVAGETLEEDELEWDEADRPDRTVLDNADSTRLLFTLSK